MPCSPASTSPQQLFKGVSPHSPSWWCTSYPQLLAESLSRNDPGLYLMSHLFLGQSAYSDFPTLRYKGQVPLPEFRTTLKSHASYDLPIKFSEAFFVTAWLFNFSLWISLLPSHSPTHTDHTDNDSKNI